uniref:Uncharacterized protein n=1 Tax=Anguilla anguilla TaxID=7936 RepID=A0A0E9PZJ1_ANGAN
MHYWIPLLYSRIQWKVTACML